MMRALVCALLFAGPARAQDDIPTLEPELKQSPATPPEADSDVLEPVPAPVPSPEPEPQPEPDPLPEDLPPPNYEAAPEGEPGYGLEAEPSAKKKKKRPPKAAKVRPKPAAAKPTATKAPKEIVIFGATLKYGFSSLAGSASEDDNSPTFGASLYVFQAPSPAKDSLGITAALAIDYEESDIAAGDEFRVRIGGDDATLSLVSLNALVCFFSNFYAKVCPFVGYGSATVQGELDDFANAVFPYGLNVVSGSPRIFHSMGILAGGELMLYQPVWVDDEADRNWSASVGSASLYLGASF